MINKYKIRFVYLGILVVVLFLFFMRLTQTGTPKVVGSKLPITGKHCLYLDLVMDIYVQDNGILPSLYELQEYMDSIKGGTFDGQEALVDEWGNKLIYVVLSTNSYEFISMGKDCKRNTDDDIIWLGDVGHIGNK